MRVRRRDQDLLYTVSVITSIPRSSLQSTRHPPHVNPLPSSALRFLGHSIRVYGLSDYIALFHPHPLVVYFLRPWHGVRGLKHRFY